MTVFAQNGIIQGRVFDAVSNEEIPFANVIIQGTTVGASTDIDGNYKIENLATGLYNVEVSYLGYETSVEFEIQVQGNKPAQVDFALEENSSELEEVVIKAKPFSKTAESPVSLKTIGVSEIKRNPGGNRDISKVIQSLPGVASTVSFRNDILIRGGSPAENTFYIDGIEIPTINHFATQGSSGGPVGMINVDFVKEVNFYSGAFPADRANALSSVFNFEFKEGRKDRIGGSLTLGSSDLALVVEGPLSKKNKDATFIFSARRSYLQFLFAAIGLPFLPTYNDFQTKINIPINKNHRLTFIGIGAIDDFVLNEDDKFYDITNPDYADFEFQRYALQNIPVNEQWNYTNGLKYTWFRDNSYTNVVLSRSRLNNSAFKYLNNDENEIKLFDYLSTEQEHKLRIENITRINGYKITAGVGLENAIYTNETNRYLSLPESGDSQEPEIQYESKLPVNQYGLFAQVSRSFLENRLTLSAGFNAWGNGYNNEMKNLFKQTAPRFSVSYAANEQISLNANAGLYYQLPAFTVLGYKENDEFVNRENMKYIRCGHLVGGIEFNTLNNSRFTLEGFYKKYNNYPFSVRDSISLANLGGDFGVVGDDEFISNSEGRSYGMEFLFQQKLYKGFYGLLAYTLSWSQFEDKNGELVASSWDNRHTVSLTGGKQFKKNWEMGAKWLLSSGAPFTPDDLELSSLRAIYDARGQGVPDYNRLNQERINAYHQLDIRIDKKWFFKRFALNLFLDIQNVYGFSVSSKPFLVIDTDTETGEPLINPDDPSRYQLKSVDDANGIFQPTIGVIWEI